MGGKDFKLQYMIILQLQHVVFFNFEGKDLNFFLEYLYSNGHKQIFCQMSEPFQKQQQHLYIFDFQIR